MKIQRLQFDDHKEHWHLQETHLEAFNLYPLTIQNQPENKIT